MDQNNASKMEYIKNKTIILRLWNRMTEIIQVTDNLKYLPRGPHVGQPCPILWCELHFLINFSTTISGFLLRMK
jgi:hypothetical protein